MEPSITGTVLGSTGAVVWEGRAGAKTIAKPIAQRIAILRRTVLGIPNKDTLLCLPCVRRLRGCYCSWGHSVSMARKDILLLLGGGDRHSIGQADRVAEIVSGDPKVFPALIAGLWSGDPLVRMRAAFLPACSILLRRAYSLHGRVGEPETEARYGPECERSTVVFHCRTSK